MSPPSPILSAQSTAPLSREPSSFNKRNPDTDQWSEVDAATDADGYQSEYFGAGGLHLDAEKLVASNNADPGEEVGPMPNNRPGRVMVWKRTGERPKRQRGRRCAVLPSSWEKKEGS